MLAEQADSFPFRRLMMKNTLYRPLSPFLFFPCHRKNKMCLFFPFSIAGNGASPALLMVSFPSRFFSLFPPPGDGNDECFLFLFRLSSRRHLGQS